MNTRSFLGAVVSFLIFVKQFITFLCTRDSVCVVLVTVLESCPESVERVRQCFKLAIDVFTFVRDPH